MRWVTLGVNHSNDAAPLVTEFHVRKLLKEMGYGYDIRDLPLYKLHIFGAVAKYTAKFEAEKQKKEMEKMKMKRGHRG